MNVCFVSAVGSWTSSVYTRFANGQQLVNGAAHHPPCAKFSDKTKGVFFNRARRWYHHYLLLSFTLVNPVFPFLGANGRPRWCVRLYVL